MSLLTSALANPKSTVIGVLILGCLVLGMFYPGTELLCQKAVEGLIALGFIATADGATLQASLKALSEKMRVPSAGKVVSVLLLVGAVATMGGCSAFKSKAGADATFGEIVQAIKAACNDPEVMKRLETVPDVEAVNTVKNICQAVK